METARFTRYAQLFAGNMVFMKIERSLRMNFFGFGKKKKETEPKQAEQKENKPDSMKEYIKEQIQSDSPENAVIAYILMQAKENKIHLGHLDNATYVSFDNEHITNFMKDWYGLLRLYEGKRLSENTYANFIESTLSQITAKPKTDEKKEVLQEEVKSDQKVLDEFDDLFGT